ncbi:hypothetical protein DFJ77DRAFT_169154 [Powellomyces hirtus]|nr:hypothetical protein DFJ77DRAFT_169154 [Powellomyces hirtus]
MPNLPLREEEGDLSFNTEETIYSSIILALAFIVAACNSLLIVAVAVQRHELAGNNNLLLVFNVACWDLLYGVTLTILYCINVFSQGFVIGQVGCQLQGFVLNFIVTNSIWGICSMLLERYAAIVRSKPLEYRSCFYLIASGWAVCAIFSSLPSFVNGAIRQPSGVYCIVDWTTSNGYLLILVIWDMLLCSAGIALMLVTYYMINKRVREVQRRTREATHGPSYSSSNLGHSGTGSNSATRSGGAGTKPSREESAMQRRIFIKSVMIASAFVICWSPYCLLICISVFRIATIPPWYDGLAASCTYLNAILNPCLVIWYDKSVRDMVKHLFGRA